jgi:hypothetical protein
MKDVVTNQDYLRNKAVVFGILRVLMYLQNNLT